MSNKKFKNKKSKDRGWQDILFMYGLPMIAIIISIVSWTRGEKVGKNQIIQKKLHKERVESNKINTMNNVEPFNIRGITLLKDSTEEMELQNNNFNNLFRRRKQVVLKKNSFSGYEIKKNPLRLWILVEILNNPG